MKRRPFLVALAGAVGVGWHWGAAAQPKLPGSLAKQPLLDGWVRIGADGRIGVFTGKAELGQGIKTALIQIAADELAVSPDRIVLTTADTALTADEGYTAGSHSMQDSGTAIRHAAAQVRALLLARAAERLALPAAQLVLDGAGNVSGGGRSLGYAALADGGVLHVPAAPQSAFRPQRRLIGQPLPRVDIPAKLTGGVAYLQDLRLPGMVHGRVVRPQAPLARLLAADSAPVLLLPGVLQVVRDGSFIAVVAAREFQAVVAARALAAATRWDAQGQTLPDAAALPASLRAAPAETTAILDRGSVQPAAAVSARYSRPYLAHGSIGPSCAVAQWQDGRLTVWSHTQGVFPLRQALAELLRLPPDRVRCIHAEGAGCYGHNGADDVAADAALLARALPGRPVRVQWMREDEHGSEPYGPPMLAEAAATLGADGRIASWQYAVWSNTHSTRPGAAGDLLAGRQVDPPFTPTPPKPIPQPEGGGDRNAIPLYVLPNARVVHHFLPAMPLRVSALRGLGAYLNVFAIESFVDELALTAHADPVAFRLRHLDDARARAVVDLAAARFGWAGWQRPPGRRGRGFAFARYKNLGAYCAVACEVEVGRDSGEITVLRVVAAVDSGEAVNPDGIRNQIEGGIVQSTSWTLVERLHFDRRRVTSVDWGGYPILRFTQMPRAVEVHVIDRPGEPFLGTGEAAQGPTGAALANAVADATGVRLRDLPLDRARVRAALA